MNLFTIHIFPVLRRASIIPFFCLLIIYSSSITFAQHPYTPTQSSPFLDGWRWKHIKELDGKGFSDACESQDGTMWFAIKNGLMHYDGYSWETFIYENELIGLEKTNEILVVDSTTVYLGTSSGFYVFDYTTHTWECLLQQKEPQLLIINSVNRLDNGIVVGCSDIGLIAVANKQTTLYTLPENIPHFDTIFPDLHIVPICDSGLFQNMNIRDAISYKDEVLLLAQIVGSSPIVMEADITPYDSLPLIIRQPNLTNAKHQFASFGVFTYSEIVNNEVWVVSEAVSRGVSVYNGQVWRNFNLSDLFHLRNHQSGIVQLRDSTIVVAGSGMLYALNNNKWNIYQKPEVPFPSSVYLRIEATHDGNLWVGGQRSEVYFLEYSTDRFETLPNLAFQFERAGNEKWFISSDNKIVINKNGKWTYYDQSDGVVDFPIKLLSTKNGHVWCGGSSNEVTAISVFDGDKWNRFLFDSISWGIELRSLFEHPNGSVWFGSPSGSRQADNIVKQTSGILIGRITPSGYQWKHIHDGMVIDGIAFAKDRKVYFSDFFSTYIIDENSKASIIKGVWGKRSRLVSSPSGNLIFGTEDNGLFLYDSEKFTQTTIDNGLTSNTIIDILPISDSTLWIATEKDFSYFDGQTWINYCLPNEFLFEKRGGSMQLDKSKNIWINKTSSRWTLRSFNREFDYVPSPTDFFSVRITPDSIPPRVMFDYYKETIDKSGNTIISWKGLDFYNQTSPENLLFSYKLDNHKWSSFSTSTSSTFFSLKPGKHTIQIKAKDQFGNISIHQPSVSFFVEAPIWFQPWFIVLMILFISIIIFLISRITQRNASLSQVNKSLSEAYNRLELQSKEIQWTNNTLKESKLQTQALNEELQTANENLFEQNEKLENTIKDLKRTQSQLVQSEKLASVGILTAGIAHELNNPLNFILGGKTAIEHYIDDYLPQHSHELTPLLHSIDQGVDRCIELIKSLNRFNRTSDEQKEHCNIREIIDSCLIMLQHELKNRITVSTHYSTDNFVLIGNEGKLHQVFLNVLTNAQQAILDKGAINIQSYVSNNNLIIKIADNGVGIDEKNLRKLTDPFYTTKDPGKGTGLGLSITLQILKEHNGDMHFESAPGKGTIVTIYLPVLAQAAE